MKTLLNAALIALALATTAAHARLPSWYPPGGFEHWGKVDQVGNAMVIVDDVLYYLNENVPVHSLSQTSDSLSRVRKGVVVGFTYGKTADGKWMIDEIWLLPGTYSQPDD
jgi:hypothetical protein